MVIRQNCLLNIPLSISTSLNSSLSHLLLAWPCDLLCMYQSVQAVPIKYHRLGGSNSRVIFSGSPRSGCQHGRILVTTFFLACRKPLSMCSHGLFLMHVCKEISSFLISLCIRVTIPSDLVPTLITQLLPKGPISKYHYIGNEEFNKWTEAGNSQVFSL